MDTRSSSSSSFNRLESHVAQQSRRDKLRIQQASGTSLQSLDGHPLHHFPNNTNTSTTTTTNNNNNNHNLEHLSTVHARNNGSVLYDPSVFPSEIMLNFSTNPNVLPSPSSSSAQRDPIPADDDSSLANNMSNPILSSFDACGSWSGLDNNSNSHSHRTCDWVVNSYASGSLLGREGNQKPMFGGEVLSNNARVGSNITTSADHYLKPGNFTSYQGLQLQPGDISGQDCQKQFTSHQLPLLYQNTIQDVVTSASFGGGERVLLPSYGNQSTSLHFNDNASVWINRSIENCQQWSCELDPVPGKNDQELRAAIACDASNQGLSLSLSSNPPPRVTVAQFREGYESEFSQSKADHDLQGPPHEELKFGIPKPSIIVKGSGRSLHDLVGTSTHVLRNTGPLGPFTGYATILKNSRFLQPAQELFDEICSGKGSKLPIRSEVSGRVSGEVSASASADAQDGFEVEVGAKCNNYSCVSSSAIHSSKEGSGDCGAGSSSCESYRPEYQQKKAKLLYLQEEVCRRYKQYHQQMQMVASSFESVAGLSVATPYVSLALKTVSRNFRCLKHAILDQLVHVTKALGGDLLSCNTGVSSSKGNSNTSKLRYIDQSLQNQKFVGNNVGFFEPQQHVWRPQRGLPERSVAILRAWLFDHFLHPYPTDTDKHMLATQTGLSRNQVSNWFINARVRVWKPMVEEIHMLETNQNSGRCNLNSVDGITAQPNGDQSSNKLTPNRMPNNQLEHRAIASSICSEEQLDAEQWNQEKRLRVEFSVPTSADASLMSFSPYQRSGIDIGGLGAVSLTLGLRHGVAESSQQQQQQMHQREEQLRRQFGGQMIHDLAG